MRGSGVLKLLTGSPPFLWACSSPSAVPRLRHCWSLRLALNSCNAGAAEVMAGIDGHPHMQRESERG
eukprot:5903600-Amphidinium_carterae.1